jgi:hypothetical protein
VGPAKMKVAAIVANKRPRAGGAGAAARGSARAPKGHIARGRRSCAWEVVSARVIRDVAAVAGERQLTDRGRRRPDGDHGDVVTTKLDHAVGASVVAVPAGHEWAGDAADQFRRQDKANSASA